MKIGIIVPYYENSSVMKDKLKWLINVIGYQMPEFEAKYKDFGTEIEVAIIDDGSKANWLDEYNSHFFKIIHLKTNCGVSEARNAGLEYFIHKVDYIGFIDADDSVSTDYIEEAYRLMLQGYDFIDSRLIQDGIEIFGTNEGYSNLKKIIRGGVAGCFFKNSVIKGHRFNKELQIAEDTTFVKEVIDLEKNSKAVSMGVYIYNHGINTNSLTMRHARGEISEKFEKDYLTIKYEEILDNNLNELKLTFNELGENGVSLDDCYNFADRMKLNMDMPQSNVVVFKSIDKIDNK